jgi:hypothetical protein
MHEEYVKKLELENKKLYQERSKLYDLIKIVSATNNLQINFESIINFITPDLVVNYALKTYQLVKKTPVFSSGQWVTIDISGKQHTFIYQDKSYTIFEQDLIVKLFRAIWDDYNAKTQNKNTFNLLLDIIGNSYNGEVL